MKIVSIKINHEIMDLIRKNDQKYIVDNANEYIVLSIKKQDLNINIFSNKKSDSLKAVFTGPNALIEARKYDKNASLVPSKKLTKESKYWLDLSSQIGSDEVGTGDFFGPICVCASFVKESDIDFLKELGVNDSKKLDDAYIKKIAPLLIKRCDFSQVSINNEKYNQLIKEGYNMNAIKARLHNQAFLHMKKAHPEIDHLYLDQFCSSNNYYQYISVDKEKVNGIIFREKGESAYPSIALGSIIARYSFILKMDELNKKYHTHIPYGAGNKVNDFAKSFVKKHGIKELEKIVKKNFKNYQEIIDNN